jgi:inner membrane transporter RhtA
MAAGRLGAAMALSSIVAVQCGAALATTLFDSVGALGAVFLRGLLGALLLLALARGSFAPVRGWPRDVVLFGAAVAGVTLCFYAAIARLPLGIAVALEFVGPLGVAVAGSRRRLDLLWVLLAAGGIVLLSGALGSGGINAFGAALALLAGGFWAAYIVLSARVGARYPGLGAVAAAGVVSALLLAPAGIAAGGAELLAPANLAVGLAVGLLSSAAPYALELEALRRLPTRVFGVLMSLEPAVAAAVGFLALSQDLGAAELAGIALVVVASAGVLRTSSSPPPRDG